MTLDISNCQQKIEYTADMESFIERCIAKTIELESSADSFEISVVLMDDEGIARLNKEYRGLDGPTDVLSFCMQEHIEEEQVIPEGQEVALGDIIISLEKAQGQADEYGHDFLTELGFLTIHGMLHLLGYDHQLPDQEIIMRGSEKKIMDMMGLMREDEND